MARKFGRGFPVRFFTPVKITVEVAKLTPRPSREALRFWIRRWRGAKKEMEIIIIKTGKMIERRMRSGRLSLGFSR